MPRKKPLEELEEFEHLSLEIKLSETFAVLKRMERIMSHLDEKLSLLESKVAEQVSVNTSVINLLGQLSQSLKDAQVQLGNESSQSARLQAVIDGIDASVKSLSDAVSTNAATPVLPVVNPPV